MSLDDNSYLIIESESITDEISSDELETRKRRFLFYENCGAVHTDIVTSVFGVQYDILISSAEGKNINLEQALLYTKAVYHDMYPSKMIPVSIWKREAAPVSFKTKS